MKIPFQLISYMPVEKNAFKLAHTYTHTHKHLKMRP